MKDDKSKSELGYKDLTQSDKDLVAKLVKGGFSRREVLKLSMVTGVSQVAAEHLLFDGKAAIAATPKKGVSTGEYDNIKLAINSSGLEAGTHTGTVEISSKDTVDSPKVITITLKMN